MPTKTASHPPKSAHEGPSPFTATQSGLDRLRVGGYQIGVTPRYLFRVHDAKSLGITSTSLVSSSYANLTLTNHKNLLKGKSGVSELYTHLNWAKTRGASNLVSWTSSLVFAIQLALYKHTTRPASENEKDLSDVFILIIDTTKFPKGSFLRDKDAMNFFRHNGSWNTEFETFYQMRTKIQNPFYFW